MPTTRPRLVITETDQVARALDGAAAGWPEDRGSRAKLLLHLVEEGHRVLVARDVQRDVERRAAIERTSGVLDGVFQPDYLQRLREDWPA